MNLNKVWVVKLSLNRLVTMVMKQVLYIFVSDKCNDAPPAAKKSWTERPVIPNSDG